MALFSVDFYSKSLFRPVNFKLFVPNDVPPEMKMGNTNYERPTKILALLHGYNGGNLDWALYSNASEISSKYNLAVILPSGENRIKGMPEWAVTTLSCLANFLGLAILISIQYIVYAQTGTFVFNAMRTHNLFPFLVQVPVATLITRRYFKETGSIYLGSFTIAMLYTMMQVTQVSTNLGLIP